jgi:hypothetical protein
MMTSGAAVPFVDTLRDAAVRDLGWLLASPGLLTAAPGAPLAAPWDGDAQRDAAFAWLAALDAAPAPLHRALDGLRPVRLGRYAECLLEYFLAHGPRLRLVAANLALRSNGQTLGEVDFLVDTPGSDAPGVDASGVDALGVGASGVDTSGVGASSVGASSVDTSSVDTPGSRRLHWELAVKCYLYASPHDFASLADFVGPNLVDRFDRKRARLIDHQLRLGERDAFAQLGYGTPAEAQMFVKGWLFYPVDASAPRVAAEIGADHPRGFWVTHAQWPAWSAAQPGDAGWAVLPRLAWLAPRRIAADADAPAPFDPSPGPPPLGARQAPALIGVFRPVGEGTWRETSRGFVVPDDWPARAAAFAAS